MLTVLTIDEMIQRLQTLRSESPLGGLTPCYLSPPNMEYMPITAVDKDPSCDEGTVIIIESDVLNSRLLTPTMPPKARTT